LKSAASIERFYHPGLFKSTLSLLPSNQSWVPHEMIQVYVSSASAWLLPTASVDFLEPEKFEALFESKVVKHLMTITFAAQVLYSSKRSKEWALKRVMFIKVSLFKVEWNCLSQNDLLKGSI
jgi:hypothetical protein